MTKRRCSSDPVEDLSTVSAATLDDVRAAFAIPPFIRSQYNYDMNEASDESGLACTDLSLAKQSFAEEVDINTIVRRFGLSGELPSDVRMPTFGDFSDVVDFHSAMNAVARARESFDAMPADVRFRFDNDPQKFVSFCSDDKNREEVEKLGLVSPEALERKRKALEAATAIAAKDAAELQEVRRRASERPVGPPGAQGST